MEHKETCSSGSPVTPYLLFKGRSNKGRHNKN